MWKVLSIHLWHLYSLVMQEEEKVQRQDPHTDKRQQDKVHGIAALHSVSAAKDNKANVGIIRNSASNLKKLLVLRRYLPKFNEIFMGLNLNGQNLTTEEIENGWDLVCKLFIAENRNEFKSMSAVELHLLQFEYLVLDTDLVHWGGNYCQCGHLNIRYSNAILHDGSIEFFDFINLTCLVCHTQGSTLPCQQQKKETWLGVVHQKKSGAPV